MSCMVCCCLVRAPTGLERTQDMHNGIGAVGATAQKAPGSTTSPPCSTAPTAHAVRHALGPKAVRPQRERPWGDGATMFKHKFTSSQAEGQAAALDHRASSVPKGVKCSEFIKVHFCLLLSCLHRSTHKSSGVRLQ